MIEKEFDSKRLYEQLNQWLDEEIVRCCITGWVEIDNDSYEAVVYFIQKTSVLQEGIAIFGPEILTDIYLQGK
jgi:hypothetical protein